MQWNKKTAKAMLTILVVALVGMEVQIAIEDALNKDKDRPDIIRRVGRARSRGGRSNKDGVALDDDLMTIRC